MPHEPPVRAAASGVMGVGPAWARYRARRALLYHPTLGPLYASAATSRRPCLVRRDTALLIEGYPRSANTFAVVAFESANGTDVRLAHHLHSPVNVERAVRYGIPAVVLVRDPVQAVASHMVRAPWVRPQDGLVAYRCFYERVLAAADGGVVAADFRQVVTDFGEVIRRVNRQFDTSFQPYEPGLDDQGLLRRIDEIELRDGGGPRATERVSRPHPERREATARALARLHEPRYAQLADQARRVYAALLSADP